VSFSLLLNLASVCNTEDKSVLWGFITRYASEATPEKDRILDELVGRAINYYRDFVKPSKKYRAPTVAEQTAMTDLLSAFEKLPSDATAEDIQNEVYAIGKAHEFENLRDWFKALYEILLGQEQGPRMGSFVALFGLDDTRDLIRRALAGDDLNAT
jgi:lysyl-tRNA synthetase class 1